MNLRSYFYILLEMWELPAHPLGFFTGTVSQVVTFKRHFSCVFRKIKEARRRLISVEVNAKFQLEIRTLIPVI